ncbi:MAG: DUF4214 domain-containing protein [Burkholderiales bacterium]
MSADMRLTENAYGISTLQNFDAFFEAFNPISSQILQNTPTIYQVRQVDANGAFVIVTIQGDFAFNTASAFTVETTEVRETMLGAFNFIPSTGLVFGTANELLVTNAQNSALITRFADFNLSVDSSVLEFPTDDVFLSGQDMVTAGSGNDYLLGYAANDSMDGGAGADTIEGGFGADTAIFHGAFRQYVLTGSPLATAAIAGPDGSDSLISIENLKFLDGTRSYDAGSHIWQVQRLYGAAFDRAADPLGLNFHSARLDAGTSLTTAAQDFVNSPEFQATYGNLNNNQFVNQLYLNALNRPADSGGLANWVNFLNSGGTRGQVVVAFSESQENINNNAAQTAAGLWDINETAGTVARLYRGALERAPDIGGLTNWVNAINGGTTFSAVANGITGSLEFQNAYGSLNNTQFVNQLYLNVLERPADPGGLANWVNALNAGTSRGDVTLGFTESTEYQVTTIGVIDQGIVLL